MKLRFLHAADIHMGHRQYGSEQRMNDFSNAFRFMIRDALASNVDLVLLAGDLFHKRDLDPRTFIQAATLLDDLRSHGIPVLAIQGNHEGSAYRDAFTWLDGLAELGLLRVLAATYSEGQMVLEPYDDETKTGAYFDYRGIRVYGLRYAGASTTRVVEDFTAALKALPPSPSVYNILMLHTGIEGIIDQYAGNLSREQLWALRPWIDYVALGHIHKPFAEEDWIYNPGSLENNAIDESEWNERGYYIVDVDTEANPRHHATLRQSHRRRTLRCPFSVEAYHTPEDLYAALRRELQKLPKGDDKPVLEVRLTGLLLFQRADLDLNVISNIAEQEVAPLLCLLQDHTRSADFEIRTDREQSREEIERFVLQELVERDVRRREQSAQWADLALRLKRKALERSHPLEIIQELKAFLALESNEKNPGHASC